MSRDADLDEILNDLDSDASLDRLIDQIASEESKIDDLVPVLSLLINAWLSVMSNQLQNCQRMISSRARVQSPRFFRPAFDYFHWICQQRHNNLFRDNYRMQVFNFKRFSSAVSPFLVGQYDHYYAIAVWPDWVTSGDSVRRQESRFHQVSIGSIQFYRTEVSAAVIKAFRGVYFNRHLSATWCQKQSE